MAEHKVAEIGDDVPFWFAANDTGGSGDDGASPVYDVRLAGEAAGAIPIASGSATLLSHANYPAGCHEIVVDTDGYAEGDYGVFCTLLVDSENPSGFVGGFRMVAAGASPVSIAADWLNGGRLDLLLDAIPTTAMRGTDSAALASVATEARLAELDAGNLPTDIAAIPTTAMRGTDSAALASVATEARLAELDAGNLPTDIAAIPTTAMRGTDSAALASVATEARLAELDAANLPTDVDAILADTGTDGVVVASINANAINAAAIAAAAIDDATFAADTDVYTAKITLIDDEGAGTPADRWLVAWFKNGVPLGTGTVTSPTIQVIKTANGTNLIAASVLSEAGSTGYFERGETSSRVVSGVGYIAVAAGTIGGSGRTWAQPISRDSTA